MSLTNNPFDMSGKQVLITGASSGLGRAAAIMQAECGARLILNGRNMDALHETFASLHGEGHIIAPFDLNNIDGVFDWMQQLRRDYGSIDGLVHCAGIQEIRPITAFNLDIFNRIMQSNVATALALAKGFRFKRDKSKQGAIVYISSTTGVHSHPCNVVYGVSKAGIIAMLKGMAIEFLKDNVRVNCVAPGLIETPLLDRVRETMTESQKEHFLDRYPMGTGQPEDVAYAISFLLSDHARWINAITIPVDGAYLAT